jgi:homoserine kinase
VTPFRAFAPASIGNVAAGFDVLGAALAPEDGAAWGDCVEAAPGESDSFTSTGPFASELPADPAENLVPRAKALLEEALGARLPPLRITLEKGLPLSSGLGSSSASIVAALVACNAAAGSPLSKADLLPLAGRAEGFAAGAAHLDNVAPCLLGGLRLLTAAGRAERVPFPDDLRFVVVHPDLRLSTAVARAALPREVPLALAVAHAQNLACLIHSLHTGDRGLLAASLRDPLAEPHRAGLVPGFRAVQRAALEADALGCSLSGAGPSLFAVAEARDATSVGEAIVAAFAGAGLASGARVCRLDAEGARLL